MKRPLFLRVSEERGKKGHPLLNENNTENDEEILRKNEEKENEAKEKEEKGKEREENHLRNGYKD